MESKEFSLKTLFFVYLTLMTLLILTVVVSQTPLGAWSAPISLFIAALKTLLIGFFFMKLGLESKGLRVIALAGFFWLVLLSTLIFADYLTRFSFGVLGK